MIILYSDCSKHQISCSSSCLPSFFINDNKYDCSDGQDENVNDTFTKLENCFFSLSSLGLPITSLFVCLLLNN